MSATMERAAIQTFRSPADGPKPVVVYCNGLRRPDQRGPDQMRVAELRSKGQTRQIEALMRLIPSKQDKFL